MVYAFLADGLEEVECLSVVDILRRAGIPVTLVAVSDTRLITGSHQIRIDCDQRFEDTVVETEDVLFLPGGVPGVPNLRAHEGLMHLLKVHNSQGGRIAAICAAPSILGDLGLLKGHKATCYPGWESHFGEGVHVTDGVITDGTITTARGLGYGLDLGLELVRLLLSSEKSDQIRKAIQYPGT